MGRFAYQPLNEEQVKISQPGQVIMGRQDGHISVNKNGIIVSKTKEIEEKIEDINELKHDVEEQEDVILNLIEDFKDLVKNTFEDANKKQEEVLEYDNKLLAETKYLDDLYKTMGDKLDRIQELLNDLVSANNLQSSRLNTLEIEGTQALTDIGDKIYVQNEYNRIMAYGIGG